MTSDYTVQTKQKFKRIGRASVLCGIVACVVVALIGAAFTFGYYWMSEEFEILPRPNGGVWLGFMAGTIACTLNWFFGYITIPITIIILFFTIGRMPKRGIMYRRAYFKWSLILGAVLVSIVTTIGTPIFINSNGGIPTIDNVGLVMLGAGMSGFLIGALSGLIIGWLFHAIVRPTEQVRTIDASVF